jgi:hypothetical protein
LSELSRAYIFTKQGVWRTWDEVIPYYESHK